jgi:molecular chaperone GrpE
MTEEIKSENTENTENKEKDTKAAKAEKSSKKSKERAAEAEIIKLGEALEKAEKAALDAEDKYKRILAEYDNYRKRTIKEKEGIYADAYGEAIKEILPVIDNLERAALCSEGEKVLQGVKMTLTQFESVLERLGVEKIEAEVGSPFDPELHNAVLHTENPELGENVIAAVLQNGYKKGDKVFRYAMVSVAN